MHVHEANESFGDIQRRADRAIVAVHAAMATSLRLRRQSRRLQTALRLRRVIARTAAVSELRRPGASERSRRAFMAELGCRVRARRVALGTSQIELARAASTSQTALSRLEQGHGTYMPAVQVLNIVRVLGFDEYDITYPALAVDPDETTLFERYAAAFDRTAPEHRAMLAGFVDRLVG